MIIVPTSAPGFHLVRNIPIMGLAGSGWHSHAEILYQSCRVPQANLLGPEGQGFVIVQARLRPGRIHHCMRWIGICNRFLELMCQRAQTRLVAPGQTLANQQIIQDLDRRERCRNVCRPPDGAQLRLADGDRGAQGSAPGYLNDQILYRRRDAASSGPSPASARCLGMTDDTMLASFYRHERAARIYNGVDEVHKISVAKRILKEQAARRGQR
ncbi:hypothetical protein DFAR_3970006 [Desulfarculales bacterium]